MTNNSSRLAFFLSFIILTLALLLMSAYVYSKYKRVQLSRDTPYKYFQKYDASRFRDSLVYFVNISDRNELQAACQQLTATGSSMRLFVDSLDGTILVNAKTEWIDCTNAEAGGLMWDTAFHSLRIGLEATPNKFVTDRYEVESSPEKERFGVFYYDQKRAWIFGLVIDQEYYRQVYDENINILSKVLWFIPVLFFAMLIGIFYLYRQRYQLGDMAATLQEFKLAMDRSQTGIALMNADSLVTWTNDTFDEWYGTDFINKKLVEKSSYRDIEKAINKCLEEGKAEYRNSGVRDGKHIVSAVTLSLLEKGKSIRILMNTTNISEVIQTYEIIAHDMKAPLTPARISAYNMIEDLQKEQVDLRSLRQKAERVHTGIVRCENFARSLEAWGKYQSGTSILEPENRQLSQLVGDIIKHFTIEFTQAHIEVSTNIPESIWLKVDVRSMEAVFRNLISNAIRAMESSTIKRLYVEALNTPDSVLIRLQDTGEGMDEQMKDELFQKTTAHNGMGTYITRKFVEEHNGRVYVEVSIPGELTIITIELPKS